MKSLVLLSAAALLAAPALAKTEKKADKAAKPVHCAVMKDHEVNVADATKKKMFADYNGNRYFFCCAGCKPEFEKDPAKFAKADHIATPKK